jgi:hypothetical protein
MNTQSSAGEAIDDRAPIQPLLRTDVRSLVGSVMMGVLMVLIVSLGDRIDASLSGGAFPIFGGVAWAITMALSALFFGLPGALIAGEIQAVMDLALAVPLAPAFIVANAVGPVVFALVAHRLPMRSIVHYLIALAPAVILGNLCVAVFLVWALQVPVGVLLVSELVVIAASIGAGVFAVRAVAEAVWRSRILTR